MSLRLERFRKTSYETFVRWTVLAACLLSLGLLVGGCYNPQVKNGGFACSMTDNPPCPHGFFCVNGLCENQPGGSSQLDLSTGTGGNGGTGGTGGGGGGGGGGGTTSFDMAHAPADLAAADMAQASMCGAQLDNCSANSDCCNMVCFPGGAGSVCLF
jgi:hypothetical protein